MPPVPGVTAISLFSGCGGSDYALQRAGYDIVWANDIWPVAAEIYEANIRDARITIGDIAHFERFPDAELLVGCYPCQSYSQAGSRDWDSNTNYLYRQFDRVLRIVRPRAFIVENVNGMAFGDNYSLLLNQIYRYRLAGYRVKWAVLNARDFGVAQNRRRIFLVGIRSDIDFEYEFPQPTHGTGTERLYVSQRDAGICLLGPKGNLMTNHFTGTICPAEEDIPGANQVRVLSATGDMCLFIP